MQTVQIVQPGPLLTHPRRRALRLLGKGNDVLFTSLPETVQRRLVEGGFVELVDGRPQLTADGVIASSAD